MRRIINIFQTTSIRGIIAVMVISCCTIYLLLPFFVLIPAANVEIVKQNNQLILAIEMATLAYYFGSSKDKSDTDKQDKLQIIGKKTEDQQA